MHGNTFDGGAGGGIIWLSSTGNTELYDTTLAVNGEDAGYRKYEKQGKETEDPEILPPNRRAKLGVPQDE